MKGLLLVVAIVSIAWALLLVPATSATITFNLANAIKYQKRDIYLDFIGRMRDAAKDPTNRIFYGVPMMPPPTDNNDPKNYHFIEITSTKRSLTLALQKSNLYLVAYRDQWGAHFFKDAPSAIKNSLFDTGVPIINIGYASSYPAIQGKAGKNRLQIPLGIQRLGKLIDDITEKKDRDGKTEAECLLILIQMVAEATRFKYIENLVLQNFNEFEFYINPKVISLEENWGKISRALFINKIVGLDDLKNENGDKWVVTDLNKLAQAVGLFSYQDGTNTAETSPNPNIPEDEETQEDYYGGIVEVLQACSLLHPRRPTYIFISP